LLLLSIVEFEVSDYIEIIFGVLKYTLDALQLQQAIINCV